MPYRRPPTIETSAGHRIALRHAFGSPDFKPDHDHDLLGWDQGEAFVHLLGHADAARVQCWDARTGDWSHSIDLGRDAAFAGVRVNASQAIIAARPSPGGEGAVADLWDVTTARRLGRLRANGEVGDVIAASDDARLAVVGYRASVTAYALPAGEPRAQVRGHYPIAASPDGSMFLAASRSAWRDLCVRGADGALVATLVPPGDARAHAALFSRDNRAVVAGLSDGLVACWDLATGDARWSARAHRGRVTALQRSPDGATYFTVGADDRLCATAADGGARRWSTALRRPRSGAPTHRPARWQIAPSPGGALLAVAHPGGGLRVFDAASGAERSSIDGHGGGVSCLAFSPDGRYVASGATDGDARVHDAATGETAWTLEVDGDEVTAVEFLPDRAALRTAGRDGVVRCWSLATGLEESRWPTAVGAPARTLGARDGSRVLVRGGGRVELWSDQTSTRVAWSASVAPDAVRAGAFSRDGSRVLLGVARADEPDGWRLESLDAATGRRAEEPRARRGALLGLHPAEGGPVSIARDGSALVVADESAPRRERRIACAASPEAEARVSADGRWLLVGEARRVEVWALASPPRLAGRVDLGRLDDRLRALAVAPAGDLFAVGTRRGCVLVFALT